MSNEIATRPTNKLSTLMKGEGIQSRFRDVLGKRAPQFISSVIQVGNSLGDDCDPMTIISGSMIAASLDLPINKNLGFAWLVPFKDRGVKKAQFQMGYRGYIQLAIRTGQYTGMNAGPANKEVFTGYDEIGDARLDFDKLDPTKPTAGYFFCFRMVNGYVKKCWWSKADVDAHAKQYSQSYRGGYDSPWKTHFDQMACKTVIANELRQWGILSVEMQTALSVDQGVVRGMEANDVTFPDEPPGPVVEVSSGQKSTPNEPEPTAEQPQSGDDGDLGPQNGAASNAGGQPASQEEKPQAQTPPRTPRRRQAAAAPAAGIPEDPRLVLEATMQAHGISYDDFATWAEGVGVIPDCKSFATYNEIPTEAAQRVLTANRNGSVVNFIKNSRGAQ